MNHVSVVNMIGIKRLIFLVVLIVVAGVLAAGSYLYIEPQVQQTTNTLNSVRGEINAKRNETDILNRDFELVNQWKDKFETLKRAGLFHDQNRLAFRRRISGIQSHTKVLKASYDIPAGEREVNEHLQDAEHDVLKSEVTINVAALDDIDFYKFVYWLQYGFEGHIVYTELSMTREKDISNATLREIGTGGKPTMVKGMVKFDWRTVVPSDSVQDAALSNPFDGGF